MATTGSERLAKERDTKNDSGEIPEGQHSDTVPSVSVERPNLHRPILDRPDVVLPALAGLSECERVLEAAYSHFHQLGHDKPVTSDAAEWFLDNFHLIRQMPRQIRKDLPEGYYRLLPKLSNDPYVGFARVYVVAGEYLRKSHARVEDTHLVQFLRTYQEKQTLTMGEIWAFPTMLRLCLLETLTLVVQGFIKGEKSRRQLETLTNWLPQISGDSAVATVILGLRRIEVQDWKLLFEDVSQIHLILTEDPADIYAGMDFDSRDRYLAVVEELARSKGTDETSVARLAVGLAKEASAQSPLPTLDSGNELGSHRSGTARAWRGLGLPRTHHVGFYLLDKGRAELEERLQFCPSWKTRVGRRFREHPTLLYLGGIGVIALGLLLMLMLYVGFLGAGLLQLTVVGFLALIPVTTIAVEVLNLLITRFLPPNVLPKLEFQDGLPSGCETVVAVPAILSTKAEIAGILKQLELHYLGNSDPRVGFAFLGGPTDAPSQHLPEDQTLISEARSRVIELNKKYGSRAGGGPFFFLYRGRTWNPKEACWMGWERKRGKLVEFNHLLLSHGSSSFKLEVGELEALRKTKYVLTLDADTTLPREALKKLVGVLAHPLNRAEFDPETGRLVAGYTVVQPRIALKFGSISRSIFTRVFSGEAGLDLYTKAVSDVYQDLFGEGIYVGKGLYEVESFHRSLEGIIPENTLLSHDLFEGISGGAALATDIVLYEDYPPNFPAYSSRLHRWVRGDWQLLPWIMRRVPREDGQRVRNHLSLSARWKILDNLRRSLLAPSLFFWMALGWILLPGTAWLPALGAVLVAGVSVLACAVACVGRRYKQSRVRNQALRWLFFMVFLPYEGGILLHAILGTLIRLRITRRGLLRWTTAAQAARRFEANSSPYAFWRIMLLSPLLSVGLGTILILTESPAIAVAAPFLVSWLVSPQVAYWISRPATRRREISSRDERVLQCLAKRTWMFFERFVGAEDHWLPPDHFQERPRGLVAHRTSPTNIGLYLLSTLGAFDLGFIGLHELIVRLRNAFETLGRLESYRGHLVNWYDTRSLKPLSPCYVSTVDSGNLAACLVALQRGLLGLMHASPIGPKRLDGLVSSLDLLAETVAALKIPEVGRQKDSLLRFLDGLRGEILDLQKKGGMTLARSMLNLHEEAGERLSSEMMSFIRSARPHLDASGLKNLRIWSEEIHRELRSIQREVNLLLPWIPLLDQLPELFETPGLDSPVLHTSRQLVRSLSEVPSVKDITQIGERAKAMISELRLHISAMDLSPEAAEALSWCEKLDRRIDYSLKFNHSVSRDIAKITARARAFFEAMDFQFLFDSKRKLFHIGYNLEADELDGNHYDLLASEARVASLIAIAKGDVPLKHWSFLGRPLARSNGENTLLSWSGTMFEYLMPSILVRQEEGTLLGGACRSAIALQVKYGRKRKLPWGISESGYYHFDASDNYQYRAFGIPELGLKRGLSDDLVVAPYASLLALHSAPREVLSNLHSLRELGLLGHYGLYEAIDFTSSRLALGQKQALVTSYMAHHHGMVLLALVNYFQAEIMVQRFHSEPLIQSVELLLEEQMPRKPAPEQVNVTEQPVSQSVPETIGGWAASLLDPTPSVHFLSNGHYGVLISGSGGGYSRWNEVDLTRWRTDTTLDNWGTWIYIKDKDSGNVWSAGKQPTGAVGERYQVNFHADKVTIRRRDHGISTRVEIAVSPSEDLEIRRVMLNNHTNRSRSLLVASYGEVILTRQEADLRHPAFNKIFIESTYLAEERALLFRRRPRSSREDPVFLAHLCLSDQEPAAVHYETSREAFLGRDGSTRLPAALESNNGFSETVGATLDPIMSLGKEVLLEPEASACIAYITLAGTSRDKILSVLRRYQNWQEVELLFSQANLEFVPGLLRQGYTTEELENIQNLFSKLVYPQPAFRASESVLRRNQLGQPGLWSFGISGDYPILLVRLEDEEQSLLVHELLRAHSYWRDRGIKIDLVILNQQETGYGQELDGYLRQLLRLTDSELWLNQRGGVFLLRSDLMTEQESVLLPAVARVVFHGRNGPLAQQLHRVTRRYPGLPRLVPTLCRLEDSQPTDLPVRPDNLLFDNGLGGFSPDGREYVIYLHPGKSTPAPWVNVIANPNFGFMVSESGSTCTWSENSGENRLTPWKSDPVSDPSGEILYLRDEETGELFSPTRYPLGSVGPKLIRHGAGYSSFESHSHGIRQLMTVYVAPDQPVKVVKLSLRNDAETHRRLTATFFAEWVLGVSRESTQQHIVPEFDDSNQALLASNPYNAEFSRRVAFLAAGQEVVGLTTDRTEFLGSLGSYREPQALKRIGLSGSVTAGVDPCAALQLYLELAPGESKDLFFLIGQCESRGEVSSLLRKLRSLRSIDREWRKVGRFWDGLLRGVEVKTPDKAMNLLLNQWLRYQSLSCRIWGRTAFYQSSGALGFRDQLQDVLAWVHTHPQIASRQIRESARHQFEEGDVLHWWHPPSGRGVRTRCSDDLLWLPYVTAEYVARTGDFSILRKRLPFLQGNPLGLDEDDRYAHYLNSSKRSPLYDHCQRAINRGATEGPSKLPLIGGGDWNDGMNRVGSEGRGESVWLGWFLYKTLTGFADLCSQIGETEDARRLRKRARHLKKHLHQNAWDGQWYLRARYDDGTPLGSSENDECQVDSIAQSWAVLSDGADPGRMEQAMEAVAERLVQYDHQLILLFSPPFQETSKDPGYIKGYPPGVRENGGQYTHGAIWAAWAFAKLGQGARAESLFRLLNPIYHGDTKEKVQCYRVEPYVVAADVYSSKELLGRGGWTWYTGSAAWMYRLGLEGILGFQLKADRLEMDPCIPKSWPGFKLSYQYRQTPYLIQVVNPKGVNRGVRLVKLDGRTLLRKQIRLKDDRREHQVEIEMG